MPSWERQRASGYQFAISEQFYRSIGQPPSFHRTEPYCKWWRWVLRGGARECACLDAEPYSTVSGTEVKIAPVATESNKADGVIVPHSVAHRRAVWRPPQTGSTVFTRCGEVTSVATESERVYGTVVLQHISLDSPEAVSNSHTIPSWLLSKTLWPSGLKTGSLTRLLCFSGGPIGSVVSACQRCEVYPPPSVSWATVRNFFPSGLKTTLCTLPFMACKKSFRILRVNLPKPYSHYRNRRLAQMFPSRADSRIIQLSFFL